MPMSQTKQQSVVGTSTPALINLNAFRNGVGLIANLAGGAATFNIEVCGQDPKLPNFGTIWNILDGASGLTASANNSLAYPCTAVRINLLSIQSGSPVVTLSIVQAVD